MIDFGHLMVLAASRKRMWLSALNIFKEALRIKSSAAEGVNCFRTCPWYATGRCGRHCRQTSVAGHRCGGQCSMTQTCAETTKFVPRPVPACPWDAMDMCRNNAPLWQPHLSS